MRATMKYILVLMTLSLMYPFAEAANIAEVVYEGSSGNKTRAASRKEIMDKAVEETSLDFIRQMIGEEKTSRNIQLIKNFVIKESGKYILKIKGEDIEKVENEYKMNFRLEVELDSLKSILLQDGLLYEMEGPSKVLPFISWSDKVNSEAYSWWTDDLIGSSPLGISVTKSLHDAFRKELSVKGFYGIEPIGSSLKMLIPESFSNSRINNSDLLFLGDYFSAPIVIKGKVEAQSRGTFSNNYILDVKLVAYQSVNGRVIGEVSRKFETDSGAFNLVVNKKWDLEVNSVAKDLSSQVFNSWQKGTFGSSLVKVTLQGQLPYGQMELVKERLSRIGDIRAIRERLFEPGAVTFEVDTSREPQQLAKIIQNVDLSPLHLTLDEVNAAQVSFEVKSAN